MSPTTHQGAVGAEIKPEDAGPCAAWAAYNVARYGDPDPSYLWEEHLGEDQKAVWRQVYKAALSSPAPRTDGGMTAGEGISLAALQAAHVARQAEWCPDQLPDLSFRGNELAGEAGETSEALILHAAEISKLAGRASNIVKKLERERHGWRGSRATKEDLAAELADLIHCAVLCAITADIHAGQAVVEKFNATSEKQGLSVFLPMPATPAQPAGAVPDSLRALSDVKQGVVALRDQARSNLAFYEEHGSDLALLESQNLAAYEAVLGLFASHPAGQSAGSGAEIVERLKFFAKQYAERQELVKTLLDAVDVIDRKPAPVSTRTGDERTEETVEVPASALRWLFGEGPDEDGAWFGDQIRGKGAFWWRSEFRKRIEATHPAAPEASVISQGYRLIPAEMPPAVMERIASNLSDEFGPDFVTANKAFSLAVYAEAFASGVRPAAPSDAGCAEIEDRLSEILTASQRQDLSDRILGAYMAPHGGLRLDNAEVAYLWTKLGGAL